MGVKGLKLKKYRIKFLLASTEITILFHEFHCTMYIQYNNRSKLIIQYCRKKRNNLNIYIFCKDLTIKQIRMKILINAMQIT